MLHLFPVGLHSRSAGLEIKGLVLFFSVTQESDIEPDNGRIVSNKFLKKIER